MVLHEAIGSLGFANVPRVLSVGGGICRAANATGGGTCPVFYAYVVASQHIHSNMKFGAESAARTMQSCTHAHAVLSFGHCSGEGAAEKASTAESSAHIARTLPSRSAKEQPHSLVAQRSSSCSQARSNEGRLCSLLSLDTKCTQIG